MAKAYAREAGIVRLGHNLRRIVESFRDGIAQGSRDYRRIERRRAANQKQADKLAQERRKARQAKLDARAAQFPAACGKGRA